MMKPLHLASGLIFGAGFVVATAQAGDDLATTQTRDNTTPSVFKNATTPTDFSGGVAGAACVYDNYNPLDDIGVPASQAEPVYPFYAEAADDFTLLGDPGDDCILSEVIFAAVWFSVKVTPSPALCWTGVNITVYEDAEAFCGPGFVKGPAGEPVDRFPLGHVELCAGGVKCELALDPSFYSATDISDPPCTNAHRYEILVSNLEELHCVLEKDHKYWIAIAPVQQLAVCGQTGIVLSANQAVDHPAQQIFLALQLPWTVISGNGDACPPDTPPAGSQRDLAIGIAAIKTCAWDLANDDGIVDARDLGVLLGNWGNPYGPGELANLLGAWVPC